MNRKPLKVTICSHDGKNYFGGPYEWVKRFGPALRDKGVEVSFLFFSDHSATESTTYNELKAAGFSCAVLPTHSLSQYRDHTEARVKWFLKRVKENPPDVFIANAVLPALFAGKWIKAAGIPVIGVLHTDDERYHWMLEEFVSGLPDFALSALVCVSASLKEKTTFYNIFKLPLEVISCGTPVLQQQVKKDSDTLKIVYLGKLTEEAKQISLLTRAFCRAVKEIKGVEAYLYGDGPSKADVLHIIEKEAKGYPVFYKGFVPSHEVQHEIADKHVIVLLSDYEGLPIVLLEGMACGLVPVCLNIRSGIPELVQQEVTGLLVNDRGDDFIKAIRKLKEDPLLFQRLSDNARQLALTAYAMDVVAEKWMNLFDQLLSRAEPKKKIVAPFKIVLPPIYEGLLESDHRKTSFANYFFRQVLRFKTILLKN